MKYLILKFKDKETLAFSVLIAIFIPVYFSRLNFSLWYDEAAVIENASHLTFKDLRNGLNWLQTIPIGYFSITKFFLNFAYGVQILRAISLACTISAIYLANRYLFKGNTNWWTKWVLSLIILCNPINMAYASMVKPYAVELLFTVYSVYAFKYEKWNRLFILAFLGPLFSNTTFIVQSALAILLVVRRSKHRIALVLFSLTSISLFISLLFTSMQTRNMMRLVWFGEIHEIGYRSLKSGIGNIAWLPVSGLGILPESGSQKTYLLLSGVTLLLILSFVLSRPTNLTLIVCLILLGYVFAQFLIVIPAAGRLMLGCSFLLWILFLIRIDEMNRKFRLIFLNLLVFLVVFNSVTSSQLSLTHGNSMIKEVTLNVQLSSNKSSIYTNIWAGPAAKFYLRESLTRFNPNTLWLDENGLSACDNTLLKKSDLIILDFLPEATLKAVSENPNLKTIKVLHNSAVFEVKAKLSIPKIEKATEYLNCRYAWSNPQNPITES